MLNRRSMLLAAGGVSMAGTAHAGGGKPFELATMRGSIDAGEFGVAPRALDDQSKAFGRMLARAAETGSAVFLPPGSYIVSNLELPRAVRLSGVAGATRIIYGGDGHLFLGDQVEHFELDSITIDGANRGLGDQAQALIDLRAVPHAVLNGCEVIGAGKNAVAWEGCAGRIERCAISGAADAAVFAVESRALSIVGNTVADCGNGGILVHRWSAGEDNTIVSGNRVERIAALGGGTGENGNGINVFRAGNVVVSGNHVADCAFSAIRSNSGGNVQITGNTCLRSGETGIYSEFAFEGAVISNNVVDGAANGISVANFNEGGRLAVCSGNLVRNLQTDGPYKPDPPGFGTGIGIEADAAVTGNVIENAPSFGISIGWGPFLRDVVASGNVIRNTAHGIGVTVVEGAGSALIASNMISGAREGAVIGHRWADIVTGDLTQESAERFAHLTVDRNRVS